METKTKVKHDFDVERITRNGYISEGEVNLILGMNHRDKYYGLAKLEFINWLQKQIDKRIEDGLLDQYLVVKQEDWGIIFLGGVDAVRYCDSRSRSHIKNAKKQNNRIFQVSPNDIDHKERDEYQHYLHEAHTREKMLNKTTKVYS